MTVDSDFCEPQGEGTKQINELKRQPLGFGILL